MYPIGFTVIGSHLWKEYDEADVDGIAIYAEAPYDNFLNVDIKPNQIKEGQVDFIQLEIQDVVRSLLAGDFKVYLGCISPCVLLTSPMFSILRSILVSTPSKIIAPSLLAYLENLAKSDDENIRKKVYRYTEFGKNLFKDKKIQIDAVDYTTKDLSPEGVSAAIEDLKKWIEACELPDVTDEAFIKNYTELLTKYLLSVRNTLVLLEDLQAVRNPTK